MQCSATTRPSPVTWRTNRISVRSQSLGMRLRKILSRRTRRNHGSEFSARAEPEDPSPSERLERIATAVQHDIDDKRIAGAVTLVIGHGHVAWSKTQGMMDREASKSMRPDAMFRICSMTKPITSVAVMMLYEEGQFLLDDPVSKYLPEFKNPKVLVKPASGEPYSIPATKEITIRDLLRHTS